MTEYGLFWTDMDYYHGDLDDHLVNLSRWNDTPEGFQFFDDYEDALAQAKRDCVTGKISIVEMTNYTVVREVAPSQIH